MLKNNSNVIYYLLGAAASNLGNVISGLAFMFLAHEITASSVYTTISQVAPYLIFGLIGGVIADWVDKKKLLICIDLIRIPVILLLVFTHQLELLSYWHLVIGSFLIHCFGSFFNPAHRAILPMITKEAERTSVNSLYDTVTRGVTVLGPFVSILLLNTVEVIHFFTFDAITYLVSVILIYRIQLADKRLVNKSLSQRTMRDVFVSIKGFSIWVSKQTTIRTLFEVTVIMVFFNTWVWQVGLLLQLIETTSSGEEWYSILLGWYGATVIVANLLIPFFWKELSMKMYLFGSWLTNKEISDVVIKAIKNKNRITTIGQLEPWEKRP